jgi:tetratricopeptide (TPR) repeat protein
VTSRSSTIAWVVAVLSVWIVAPAWARNPHCAGGIQYVVQAGAEKAKQNYDESRRLMLKAVDQLQQCSTEDPKDYEAIGYLGWAYAEVDSACLAGKAFKIAIDGLNEKGDKRKMEMVLNNRESFWATKFNDGIAKINTAQQQYATFSDKPKDATEQAAKAEAAKTYGAALVSLNQALCLKPNDPRTLKNLGTVYALMGDYPLAERYVKEAMEASPDSARAPLAEMLRGVRKNQASRLIDEKKFDEAVAYYNDLIKADPNDADLYSGLADAQFNHAIKDLQGDARKPAFKAAGNAYAKAATIKKNQVDLPFNAALSYQNAGEWALAEPQWKAALALKPGDPEALIAYASTLADLKKYPQAVAAAEQALGHDDKTSRDKAYHHILSAMYTKAGDNERSRQEAMVYLALDKGKKIPTPGPPSGAVGQKLKASLGEPDEIDQWEADGQTYESWFYWSKGQAYHFSNGVQIAKSDWSALLAKK